MTTLTLAAGPDFDLDMSTVLPERLAGLSAAKIRRQRLQEGRRTVALGDLFTVEGEPGPELRIRNASPRLHRLGAAMTGGRLQIEGSCGHLLGSEQRGGEIRLRGNAGDYVGAGMRGGLVDISGNAGDFVGGAVSGAAAGMRGGTILVGKQAGARAGDRMRRGLIVITGDAGDYCASRVIAGTVVVLGRAGKGTGLAMRRGSVVLLREPATIPATFVETGEFALAFLAVLVRYLGGLRPGLRARLRALASVRRLVGDGGCGGLGEILIAKQRTS